ncbi:ABC transporter ATP-binding protein [Thiospirochaeta perfilievii]|uniref:ABC transporter ATP-binding protein n=1 Tax=Thiospirochaeta perfilievii TaxID=252967 RepID=A0A5C1Q9Y6_9SPIO|nr:ABC transporter ATP-binding protein [Thiospirochaeta perfilievii]QEN03719.1 ABC transporter ATP-binding protein [Thiospirochaeta perfilievii]
MRLNITNIEKKYKYFTLGPLNININRSCIVGLVGRNGAGKTTLFKSIFGLYPNKKTKLYLNEKFHKYTSSEDKENIVMLTEVSSFPNYMNAHEISSIYSKFYKNWDNQMFLRIVNKLELSQYKRVKELSLGNKKKLAFAAVLATKAPVMLLDEPTSNIDPVTRQLILDELAEYIKENDSIIFFSSHILSDINKVATELILINKGQIVYDGPFDQVEHTESNEKILELIR